MLYLYLGYVVTQLYAIAEVFSKNTMAPSALLFSLVVFVIWSFIPVLAYLLAKAMVLKAKLTESVYLLQVSLLH